MKKMLVLFVTLLVSVPAFGQDFNRQLKKIERDIVRVNAHKNNTKVTIKDDVVEIHADDLDDAKDALFEYKLIKHPKKMFKIYVAPLSQPKLGLKSLREYTSDNVRVSLSKTLIEGYRISYDIILEMMSKERPELAAKMKANPYDLRGNLTHVEQYLGLNEINSKGLSLQERCYRVCWVEGIYRYEYAEGVQLIFE